MSERTHHRLTQDIVLYWHHIHIVSAQGNALQRKPLSPPCLTPSSLPPIATSAQVKFAWKEFLCVKKSTFCNSASVLSIKTSVQLLPHNLCLVLNVRRPGASNQFLFLPDKAFFRFCSLGCQEKAISSYHKYECLLQVGFSVKSQQR